MQDKAKNLKIEKNIEFVGSVKHEKVPKYYDLMSIFVAVSTRESFGVSVLEAAACEIPSITSNVGGLPEVNLHGKTGFVLNPNEPHRLAKSILELYHNEKLRNTLGSNARLRVKDNFNWDRNVDQMIGIYSQFV